MAVPITRTNLDTAGLRQAAARSRAVNSAAVMKSGTTVDHDATDIARLRLDNAEMESQLLSDPEL
jgi:hypothetical protein